MRGEIMAQQLSYYTIRDTKLSEIEIKALLGRHRKFLSTYNKNINTYNEYEPKDKRMNECLITLRDQIDMIRANLETGNYDFDHKKLMNDFVMALKSGVDSKGQSNLLERGNKILWVAATLSVDNNNIEKYKKLKKEEAERKGEFHYATMDDEPDRE